MKILLFFITILSLFISSCSQQNKAGPLIALSLPTQREERWVRDKEAMILEAERLGIRLLIRVSDNDAVLQISQCEELFEKEPSLLIIAPHDARSAATIAEMGVDKGIPVISYDRLVLGAPLDLYISFNNREVGRIQARFLLDQVPRGNYIILSGSPTDNNSRMFNDGAMEVLAPHIEAEDITVLMNEGIMDWQPAEAYRLTKEALQRFLSIDAILAPNDGTARGVLKALEEAGLAGTIPLTGQDGEIEAAKLIVRGLQGMTVYKDTRALARKAIEISLALINGEEVPEETVYIDNGSIQVPTLLLDPVLVTRENLDEILIDSGYIRKEDVYGK